MGTEIAKNAIAEAIGTFALTFVGAAVICTDAYSGGEVGLVGVALAQGMILAAVVTALGHVSGAHVNPAVTLAALLVGALRPASALAYLGGQILGAAGAGFLMTATFAAEVWEPVRLGAPRLGPGVTPGTGIFIEAVLTYLLVLFVLQVAVDHRAPRHVYGLAIGAAWSAAILAAGPLTGAALNPARAFGPALAAGAWHAQHVYWLGPLLGGALAAATFRLLRPEPGEGK